MSRNTFDKSSLTDSMNFPDEYRATEIDLKFCIGDLLFTISLDRNFFIDKGDFSFPSHSHGDYEMHYLLSGYSREIVSDKTFLLGPQSCLLIPPNVYHEHFDSDHSLSRYCFKFRFRSIRRNHMQLQADSSNLYELFSIQEGLVWQDKHAFYTLMEQVRKELTYKPVGYNTVVQSLFMQIIIFIVREIAAQKNATPVNEVSLRDLNGQRVSLIEDFFNDCYMDYVKAGDLARILGISERQLGRIMKSEFRLTFKEKLLDVRIKVAMKLLSETDESIGAIATRIGYEDASTFSTIFKKKASISPIEYRKTAGAAAAPDRPLPPAMAAAAPARGDRAEP